MDILNWLYLAKNKFVRTTPSSDKDLMVFGAKVGTSKRGDLYQNYAMSIEDLGNAISPAPAYKAYTALLTQNGTNPPTALVMENTIGDITFTYVAQGRYQVVSSGLFISNKTVVLNINSCSVSPAYSVQIRGLLTGSSSSIDITTAQGASFNSYVDNILLNRPIEIRVYN